MDARTWVPLGVFGIAVWILATFTIGFAIGGERDDKMVGFGVAALAVVLGYLLPTLSVPPGAGSRMAAWLIGGGVGCVLLALALQFYQVAQAAEATRRAGDILEQAVRAGQQPSNVRLQSQVPHSVGAIGYLCVLLGAGMVVCGVRVGLAWSPRGPDAEPAAEPDPAT